MKKPFILFFAVVLTTNFLAVPSFAVNRETNKENSTSFNTYWSSSATEVKKRKEIARPKIYAQISSCDARGTSKKNQHNEVCAKLDRFWEIAENLKANSASVDLGELIAEAALSIRKIEALKKENRMLEMDDLELADKILGELKSIVNNAHQGNREKNNAHVAQGSEKRENNLLGTEKKSVSSSSVFEHIMLIGLQEKLNALKHYYAKGNVALSDCWKVIGAIENSMQYLNIETTADRKQLSALKIALDFFKWKIKLAQVQSW